MIKVLICDGDGTLELPRPSEGIRKLLEALPTWGIQLAVASNGSRASVLRKFQSANLPQPEIIVTPDDVGAKKPSPAFVHKVRELADVELNEIIYLGDDDLTDTFCAINAGVLPLSAHYSKAQKQRQYGVPVNQPKALYDFLHTFGRQNPPYFGWQTTGHCRDTHTIIDVKALIGDHSKMGLTSTLIEVLKEQKKLTIGRTHVQVQSLLFLYLTSQIYLSGLTANIDWITIYPGHTTVQNNVILKEFSEVIAAAFRDKYPRDLLLRHQDAPQSRLLREDRRIFSQFHTIMVNPEYREQIQGKRILVLDDFTTLGYSLETARRMLLKAGAAQVTCLAIAKFKNNHARTLIANHWNPFAPCTLAETDIRTEPLSGSTHVEADDYFFKQIWAYYSR